MSYFVYRSLEKSRLLGREVLFFFIVDECSVGNKVHVAGLSWPWWHAFLGRYFVLGSLAPVMRNTVDVIVAVNGSNVLRGRLVADCFMIRGGDARGKCCNPKQCRADVITH